MFIIVFYNVNGTQVTDVAACDQSQHDERELCCMQSASSSGNIKWNRLFLAIYRFRFFVYIKMTNGSTRKRTTNLSGA